MTTWYVTAGISLEGSRCWKLDGHKAFNLPACDCRTEREIAGMEGGNLLLAAWDQKRIEIQEAVAGANPDQRPARAAEQVRLHFRDECWSEMSLKALPAEVATLFLLWGMEGGVKIGDEIRIIQGESTPYVVALLKAILEHVIRDLSKITCTVTLTEKTYKLDPKDSASFNDAINDLWNAEIEAKDPEGEARFVLTGGYKAVLMALAVRIGHSKKRKIYYSYEGEPKFIVLAATDDGVIVVQATDTSC